MLGLITALSILLAPVLMPLFAPGFDGAELDLVVGLSRVLFPILVMLGVSGVVVGILNSYDRFGVFAIAPLFWNIAIIAVLVGLAPAFPEGDEIYAYAIGVVVGTALQLAMVALDLRNTPFRLSRVFDWRSRPGQAGPAADAAGDDQPRADQLQPRHQQHLRLARPRPGGGGARRRSTRRSGSTCCPRGCSRSPWRR